MQFQPKTQEEIREQVKSRYSILLPGVYDFEVLEANDRISKKGNPMLELLLNIAEYTPEGSLKNYWVRDYILSDNQPRLFELCEAINMLGDYERGVLDPVDLQGKCGRAEIIIRKDKEGQYPDQNSVKKYIAKKFESQEPSKQAQSLDDDIPF